ncbi:MAG: glycoside hydrolase family 1 protein [Polyangiaceae bacterium]
MHDFPESFRFGTATSATQVEGHCTTIDWYRFAKNGRVKNGDTIDVACDSWNRFRDDVALQRAMGLNAARLSVEWGRIEPRPGAFDAAALDHYRTILGAHVDAGIRPMVTLHHFALPQWMADRGGLLAHDLPARLARFAVETVRALGDLCREWITINEPNVLAAHAYLLGAWPPAQRDPRKAAVAHHRLLEAHVAMYRALHDADARGDLALGVAHHLRVAQPKDPDRLADRAAARVFARVFNDAFAHAVCTGTLLGPFDPLLARAGAFRPSEAKGTQDFLGVNYYSRDLVSFDPRSVGELFIRRGIAPGAETNDLGWEIYPEGLGIVLREWSRRSGGLPVYITENGVADARDVLRPRFLVSHLREVARAMAHGVDVRGYYHWSLLDNFEWAEGYGPRFGLVEVDYATQARRLRASGELYGRIARARRIEEGPPAPRPQPRP